MSARALLYHINDPTTDVTATFHFSIDFYCGSFWGPWMVDNNLQPNVPALMRY